MNLNRRKSLEYLGGLSASLLIPTTSRANCNNTTSWLNDFAERWDITTLYTNEVFNAMPDEQLLFQPTADVMSFGKQFSHLGWGNAIYTAVIKGVSPASEPKELTRKMIQDYLDKTSTDFKDVLLSIHEEELFTNNHGSKNEDVWKDFSIYDMLLIAYHHTAHHRAQAIVYLRLNGIAPPKYRF